MSLNCTSCNGTGGYKAGCSRGCLSVSQLSHRYRDTYSQHGGRLNCICTEIVICQTCNGTGKQAQFDEQQVQIAPPVETPKTPCTECSYGRISFQCSTCKGSGYCNTNLSGPCNNCGEKNINPKGRITKSIFSKSILEKHPNKNASVHVYTDNIVKYSNLKLVSAKPVDHFSNPTRDNLHYRLYLSTEKFTKNKIFINVRAKTNEPLVPIWDECIDGEFTNINGEIHADYTSYFSRALNLFNKCYILVNPKNNYSVNNMLESLKFDQPDICFVELPLFLPFVPTSECLVIKFGYSYCTSILIETREYTCSKHALSVGYSTTRVCPTCSGSKYQSNKCYRCSGTGYR